MNTISIPHQYCIVSDDEELSQDLLYGNNEEDKEELGIAMLEMAQTMPSQTQEMSLQHKKHSKTIHISQVSTTPLTSNSQTQLPLSSTVMSKEEINNMKSSGSNLKPSSFHCNQRSCKIDHGVTKHACAAPNCSKKYHWSCYEKHVLEKNGLDHFQPEISNHPEAKIACCKKHYSIASKRV